MAATQMAQSSAQPMPAEQRRRLGLAFSSFILIGANDAALGVLLPSIIAHYGIDKATAALLFPASTLGFLLAAFNSGMLLERLGRRAYLVVGAGLFLIGAGLVVLTPPFPLLLPALFVIGFGEALLDAGFNAYVAGLPRNSALLNYLHAFYGAGALLGPLIASVILARSWGWNVTYLVWLLGGILAVIGFARVFDGQGAAAKAARSKGGADQAPGLLGTTLRMRFVWICALFLFLYVGAEVSLGSWSYSLLTESRGQGPLLAGWMVSGYWLGLTIGRVVLGRVAERIGASRLILWCLVGVLAAALLFWPAPNGFLNALALLLAGFSLGPIFPSTIAVVGRVMPLRLQPTAIGFLASLGSMGGAAFPWLAGNLAQRFGLWSLLPFVAALAAAMIALWLMLQRSVETDTVSLARG
ncbi:MAG TPA: MFS transporter [Ktedonobacterales bacterium]